MGAVKKIAQAVSQFALPAEKKAVRAFHGSPHSFEKFDTSKIGTGEGAQAYGHGLYFADNESVAKGYRDRLAPGGDLDKVKPDDEAQTKIYDRWRDVQEKITANRKPDGRPIDLDLDDQFYAELDALHAEAVQDTVARNPNLLGKGHMYEVNINADPDAFLDWDKPLSEQGQSVQDALLKAGIPEEYLKSTVITGGSLAPKRGEYADELKQAGIPGIKYLDAGSRSGGEGSRNYVVFDADTIEIIKKYGIAGALGAGLITAGQADQAQAQGLGDPNTTPKDDRMQRSLETRKQEALARAQQGSARADQMATGGTGPSATVPLDYSGVGKSLATGTRNTLEAIPGMLGDVQEWSGKERWAPTSQQVGQFTDQFSPQWLQNLTRYKPQGPVEQGMAEVPQWWLG